MSVKESANHFGFELFKVFISRHKSDYKNLCFSPFAVFNSLAMIKIGSQKTTESQLTTVLRMKDLKDNKSMLKELQSLRTLIIKGNHDIILSIGFLYVDSSIELKKEYKELLKEYFEVKPKKVTFSKAEETVQTINNDSKEGTDDVIDEVIHTKDLNGENKNIKIILTNSLFFRGFWDTSFDDLEKHVFNFPKNNQQIKVEIQMIKELGSYRYMDCPQLKADIVSIPYAASDLRMIIILPKDLNNDGVYLIEYLNRDLFESIMKTLQTQNKTELELYIPRFALDAQKVSIKRTIKQMGAIDVFEEPLADLSQMCDNRIHLTKLVHKAFILVDERGAHYSDVKLKHKKLGQKVKDMKTIVFKACHPFVFIITDKMSNIAVFMGYFGDPREMLEVVRESDLTSDQINQLLTSSQTH